MRIGEERIHQDQIEPVLLHVAGVVADPRSQKRDVRAALNFKVLRVETYILERVELYEADKLFIFFEFEDEHLLVLHLQSILEADLGVSEVVRDDGEVSCLLVEGRSLLGDELLPNQLLQDSVRLRDFSLEHTSLVSSAHMDRLVDWTDGLVGEVLLEM